MRTFRVLVLAAGRGWSRGLRAGGEASAPSVSRPTVVEHAQQRTRKSMSALGRTSTSANSTTSPTAFHQAAKTAPKKLNRR